MREAGWVAKYDFAPCPTFFWQKSRKADIFIKRNKDKFVAT